MLLQFLRLSNLEVWFQRPADIVRKLLSGDLDLGIVSLDTVCEYGQIPQNGIFESINSLEDLAKMPQWTQEKPLRVVAGFTYMGPKFMKENGFQHVTFSTADDELEAAPAMGIADAILGLVSSETALRENNLKVESRWKAGLCLLRKGMLETTHEMLERLEAHLRAIGQFRLLQTGGTTKEVAERVLSQQSLSGLQGPTISPVFRKCVPKKALYQSMQQLREIGGSGVLISPLTYITQDGVNSSPILVGTTD